MKIKISWGTGILIVIGVFLGISISTGIYMMSQDVNLVADDYYDKEIKYQQQIDRIERTKKLNEENIIVHNGESVRIILPINFKNKNVEGEIHFYRPSDATADLKIPLSIDSSGVQVIPVSALAKGSWTVKVNWLVHGNEYYSEKRLFLR